VPDLFVQRGREGIPVTGQFPQKDGCRLSSGGNRWQTVICDWRNSGRQIIVERLIESHALREA